MFGDLFLSIWSILGSPKINHIDVGAHGHVRKSENHENEGFWVLPWWNRKVNPKWSRIILRSFWANLLIIFAMKWPPPDPPRPQTRHFSRIAAWEMKPKTTLYQRSNLCLVLVGLTVDHEVMGNDWSTTGSIAEGWGGGARDRVRWDTQKS